MPFQADERIHPIDTSVSRKIAELVQKGINNTREMQRHLQLFVEQMFAGKVQPRHSSRKFFPNRRTVRHHIYRCMKNCQRSRLDQDNLQELVREWQEKDSGAHIYLRRRTDTADDTEDVCDSACAAAAADDDDDVHIPPVAGNSSEQKFLFVYQSGNQQRLLRRYGSLVSLDATYRTTKYALPLFFLVVRTNVDYQVVACFVTQDETSGSIAEALRILKEWNPEWTPKYGMTDCDEQEINAMEYTFAEVQVFLCDFHREQAWERWVSRVDHGVHMCKEEVLARLRRVAHASTILEFKEAVASLQEWNTWKENVQLSRWFTNTWLNQARVSITV